MSLRISLSVPIALPLILHGCGDDGTAEMAAFAASSDGRADAATASSTPSPAEHDAVSDVQNAADTPPANQGLDQVLSAPPPPEAGVWWVPIRRVGGTCDSDIVITGKDGSGAPIKAKTLHAEQDADWLKCRPGWRYESQHGVASDFLEERATRARHRRALIHYDCDARLGIAGTWYFDASATVHLELEYAIDAAGIPEYGVMVETVPGRRPLILGHEPVRTASRDLDLDQLVGASHRPLKPDPANLEAIGKFDVRVCPGTDRHSLLTPVAWKRSARGNKIAHPNGGWQLARGRATVCSNGTTGSTADWRCVACPEGAGGPPECPRSPAMSASPFGWLPPVLKPVTPFSPGIKLRLEGRGVLEVEEAPGGELGHFGETWLAVDVDHCRANETNQAERAQWLAEGTVSPLAQWPGKHPVLGHKKTMWVGRLRYVEPTATPSYYRCPSRTRVDQAFLNAEAKKAKRDPQTLPAVHVRFQEDPWNWFVFSSAVLERRKIRRCLYEHAGLERLSIEDARRCPETGLLQGKAAMAKTTKDERDFLIDCDQPVHGTTDRYWQNRFYPFWCGGSEAQCLGQLILSEECIDSKYVVTVK